jgi:hypothetical protein
VWPWVGTPSPSAIGPTTPYSATADPDAMLTYTKLREVRDQAPGAVTRRVVAAHVDEVREHDGARRRSWGGHGNLVNVVAESCEGLGGWVRLTVLVNRHIIISLAQPTPDLECGCTKR